MARTSRTTSPLPHDTLDVRCVPLASLHQDPGNVRRHPEQNLRAIRESLQAFGQQKPLGVTQGGRILAGNGTSQEPVLGKE